MHIPDKKRRPVSRNASEKLIDRLKKTGLARNVITDEAKMRAYLEQHFGKDGAERFMMATPKGGDIGSIKNKDRKILRTDEHGKRIVWENDGYFISATDENVPHIKLWEKKTGKNVGVLYASLNNFDVPTDFIHIDKVEIDSKHRGKGLAGEMYHALIDFSGDKVKGIASYLPQRSNKKQVPRIWERLGGIMEDGYQTLRFMSTPKGEVYGFTTPEGDVYIDPNLMSANTPVHEFGHLFWSAAMPAETKAKITELLKQTPGWKSLSDNPAYANLKTDDQKADELFNSFLGDYGEYSGRVREITGDNITLFAKIQNAINEFLEWLKANVFNNTDAKLNLFAKKTLSELLGGREIPFSWRHENGNIRSQIKSATSNNGNFDNESDDIRFHLSSENRLKNSTESNNFAENNDVKNSEEKKKRIEKLRNSSPIEITGEEITPSEDLKQYKANALEYGKTIQGEYTNKDTGVKIQLQRGRKNGGIKEVLQHDYKDAEHLQSIAAIPQIIENSIFITSEGNRNKERNPNVERYDYYVVGLKIGGVDYTVRATVAVDSKGDRYYDHKLSRIEKGKLLDSLSAITNPGFNQAVKSDNSRQISSQPLSSNDSLSEIERRKLLDLSGRVTNPAKNQAVEFGSKDSVLLSILQTNAKENAENLSGNSNQSAPESGLQSSNNPDISTTARDLRTSENGLSVSENRATESQGKDTTISENNKKPEENSPESGIRFHAAPTGNPTHQAAGAELDEKINSLVFKLREAWEDRHLAVKHFLDILREKGVDIKDHNDFYMQATHQQGKSDAMLRVYDEQYQKPLTDVLEKLKSKGISMRDIENYGILKHGLERNAFKTQEAINNNEKPRADYAGISAVEKEVGKSAQDYINEFEANAGAALTAELWQRVNAATDFSLKTILDAGILNKARFDELKRQYKHYIPLRGHDAVTAEDLWKYFPGAGGNFSSLLLKANGRTSRSETPFAYIYQMAQSAIVSANKNRLNQTLLRLARLDTTGMLTANQTWYVNGVAQEADYSEDADTYRQNIEDFEARMEGLSKQGLAERKKGRLNVGDIFIEPSHKEQHAIHVFQNGKSYTVYINGNPAVSQAINGTNLVDPNKDFNKIAKATRIMAANMTTRNPLFVASNFSRDIIFTASILPVKEGGEYANQFRKSIPKASGALYRYLNGKPDMNRQEDRYMLEYIMNGAKTGFSQIVNLQRIQKQIERDMKNGNHKNMFSYLSEAIGNMNDFAENMSRFSVYVTSRKMGRSVIRSVSDAKEITVNFNRKGAGGYGAPFIRPLYLFFNAGIQSLSNFTQVAAKNPRKFTALIASYCATGMIVPLLTAMLGGDEAEEAYWQIPDWDRQSNLCIWTGKGFAKIPLPHELRVFHAMGDNAMSAILGKKSGGDAFLDSAVKLADLIPNSPVTAITDFAGDALSGNWKQAAKDVAGVVPDAGKPFAQWAVNQDFKKSPLYNQWADDALPGYKKIRINKKGESYAPAFLVDFARLTDHATGGDGAKKGLASFNPDIAQHFLSGYFGGLYTTISQSIDMAYKGILPDKEVKMRDTPFRSFYSPASDLPPLGQGEAAQYHKIQKEISGNTALHNRYSGLIEDIDAERGKLQEDVANGKIGIVELSQKITELNKRADEYYDKAIKAGTEKHWELSGVISEIAAMEKELKELQGQEQKNLEIDIAGLKRDLIKRYRGYSD
ncbi:MAG: hypothetical protein LBE71_02625 [Dysgonamonadaceae bacterium]|nr:hypothetical protein [Dysgonamonadaceae bacterium]